MRRTLLWLSCAAALLAGGAALWVVSAQSPGADDNIHPPVRMPSAVIPYEPERIIRTTLHDYLSGGSGGQKYETSGRYVTFGLPMKYLQIGMVFDNEAPVFFHTYTGWEPDPAGEGGRIVNIHDQEGGAPGNLINSRRFSARITSSGRSRFGMLSRELIDAKQSGAQFGGYRRANRLSADTYWLRETYCGFEIFERDYARAWHRAADAIEGVEVPAGIEPPFDRARLFGLPDGAGGYRLIVKCENLYHPTTGYCSTDAPFNDYIVVNYSFDGSLLCEIEEVMAAHLDLLRRSVVDER